MSETSAVCMWPQAFHTAFSVTQRTLKAPLANLHVEPFGKYSKTEVYRLKAPESPSPDLDVLCILR